MSCAKVECVAMGNENAAKRRYELEMHAEAMADSITVESSFSRLGGGSLFGIPQLRPARVSEP